MTLLQRLSERDPREKKIIDELGQKALKNPDLIKEAVTLLDSEDKNIRIGAIGILREVAREKPEYVVKHLDKVIEALNRKERPTRWIAIDILGYCAPLEPEKIGKVIPAIVKHMDPKEGTCLIVETARFLGAFGRIDKSKAKRVYPYLEKALEEYPVNAVGFVIESFGEIVPLLDDKDIQKTKTYAESYSDHKRPVVRKKAQKLMSILDNSK